eukprot:scaffold243263_cov38-Prasinocladus_malaysianus.AAC.1
MADSGFSPDAMWLGQQGLQGRQQLSPRPGGIPREAPPPYGLDGGHDPRQPPGGGRGSRRQVASGDSVQRGQQDGPVGGGPQVMGGGQAEEGRSGEGVAAGGGEPGVGAAGQQGQVRGAKQVARLAAACKGDLHRPPLQHI